MSEDDYVFLDYDVVEIINETFCGAGAGIRDSAGVMGIVLRPRQEFFGQIMFRGVFMKAAALLHGFATTRISLTATSEPRS